MIKKVRDDFEMRMKKIMRPDNLSGALARGVYPIYQKFQLNRFMTQNSSEGSRWDSYPPNSKYPEYKKKKFKSYPGGGNKMLIATSTLLGAVIGKGDYGTDKHRVLITPSSLQVYVSETGVNAQNKPFTYPSRVNEKRPFMKFSDAHIEEMKEALKKYILKS